MAYHDPHRDGTALLKDASEPYLEVHPVDGKASGLRDRGWAEARSRRGTFVARVHITDAVPIGTCFAPFHWGRQAGADRAVNNLTNHAMDPLSHQPELKFTAINLRPSMAPDNTAAAGAPPPRTIVRLQRPGIAVALNPIETWKAQKHGFDSGRIFFNGPRRRPATTRSRKTICSG